jgi:hypothetical protein
MLVACKFKEFSFESFFPNLQRLQYNPLFKKVAIDVFHIGLSFGKEQSYRLDLKK